MLFIVLCNANIGEKVFFIPSPSLFMPGIVLQYESKEIALVEVLDTHTFRIDVSKPSSSPLYAVYLCCHTPLSQSNSSTDDIFPTIIHSLEHMLSVFKITNVTRTIPCPHCTPGPERTVCCLV